LYLYNSGIENIKQLFGFLSFFGSGNAVSVLGKGVDLTGRKLI